MFDELYCLLRFEKKKKKKRVEEGHQSIKYILKCALTIRSPYDNVRFDLD